MTLSTRTCDKCGHEKPRTGFRGRCCEDCFIARLETLPPKTLAVALHQVLPTVPHKAKSQQVRELLLDCKS